MNMCHDVLVSEPFNFKSQSPEGGKDWEKIAQELNAIQNQKIQSLLAKSKIESQDVDKNKKAEKEKATAGEVRKQAMADIKKRENPDDECGMQMERKS